MGAEDLWQDLCCEPSGDLPSVAKPSFSCKFFAFVKGDGYAMLGGDEKIVLCKEAGEDNPMPVIVRDLLRKVLRLISSWLLGIRLVTQLPGLGTKGPAQGSLFVIEACGGIGLVNAKRVECLSSTDLCNLSCFLDNIPQLFTKLVA